MILDASALLDEYRIARLIASQSARSAKQELEEVIEFLRERDQRMRED